MTWLKEISCSLRERETEGKKRRLMKNYELNPIGIERERDKVKPVRIGRDEVKPFKIGRNELKPVLLG